MRVDSSIDVSDGRESRLPKLFGQANIVHSSSRGVPPSSEFFTFPCVGLKRRELTKNVGEEKIGGVADCPLNVADGPTTP